ncbi:putative transcription factor GRAS family [Medicago truncatula]|uniref:GRAS family transcription factor n=1 Tax=Medicago truncatula TaxID=3880 RepID=A0A072VBU1_MEDTR|nr:protein SHORT-ROOT [Medicago truncatula]KEH39489.1 GRAS family transcription factor [Medicago truncatula]RHN76212.1 putative transcription factor GRAS family [Medicago truncatula]
MYPKENQNMEISPYNTSKKTKHLEKLNHQNNSYFLHEASTIDMMHTSSSNHQTSSDNSSETCHRDQDGKWSSKLLKECAIAISNRDSSKIHHLLWMLNELSSPYGDIDQKLASYFLQALFSKATQSGHKCYKTLSSIAYKSHSFDSARKLILKFQEVSPWTTFGHVASNGAILEALDGEKKLHIIDISNTLCTQWPTLLEALATRNDETPHLKLTIVVTNNSSSVVVMKEVGQRMEKFARLMGVPFELNVISDLKHIRELTKERLGIQEGEAIALNCVGALRKVEVEERESVVQFFKSLSPRVVTFVEEEGDFCSDDFVKCFEECLKFYRIYFEMLEESFPPTSNERLMLERECSRSIVRVLACDHEFDHDEDDGGGDYCDKRERGKQWFERFKNEFSPCGFSDDVVDDVKALLKRYQAGWSLVVPQGDDHITGMYLTWKEEPVVWASTWKP